MNRRDLPIEAGNRDIEHGIGPLHRHSNDRPIADAPSERRTRRVVQPVGTSNRRALTELAALMEAEPGHDPLPSLERTMQRREAVVDLLDGLSPIRRRVVEMIAIERMSFRAAAAELGVSKSAVEKRYKRALAHLRHLVENDLRRYEL